MVLKTKRNVAEVHADNDDDENKCCLCMDTIKVGFIIFEILWSL